MQKKVSHKPKIVVIEYGIDVVRSQYKEGKTSRRLFYGALQLEERYNVVYDSFNAYSRWKFFINNFKLLQSADMIYMPYLYASTLVFFSFLRKLGLYRRRKLVAVCHKTMDKGSNFISHWLYEVLYSTIDVVLFHSPKNMEESVKASLVKDEHAQVLQWGDDLQYIDKNFPKSKGSFFLSSGSEQRDFRILIDAFSNTGAQLELYTNKVHYDNNYDFLSIEQGKYPHIKIEFVERNANTAQFLGQRTSECLCVVIPLLKERVNYCVGLTSVVEAMAMGKPIISSRNSFFPIDLEKEKIGFYVDDVVSWEKAIRFIADHPDEAATMGKRARLLAEQKFNIDATAFQLESIMHKR